MAKRQYYSRSHILQQLENIPIQLYDLNLKAVKTSKTCQRHQATATAAVATVRRTHSPMLTVEPS